jgi:hypothetical protein
MKILNKIIDFITAPFNLILKNTVGFNNPSKLSRSVSVFFTSLIVVLLLLFLIYGKELFM